MACDALKIRIQFDIILNLLLINLKVCLYLYFMRHEFLVNPGSINIPFQIGSDSIQFNSWEASWHCIEQRLINFAELCRGWNMDRAYHVVLFMLCAMFVTVFVWVPCGSWEKDRLHMNQITLHISTRFQPWQVSAKLIGSCSMQISTLYRD